MNGDRSGGAECWKPSPGEAMTRSRYQEPARQVWNGCDFLERSDRSVSNGYIEKEARKAGNRKGPIKCGVRLIEHEAYAACEKVNGIRSGGAGCV